MDITDTPSKPAQRPSHPRWLAWLLVLTALILLAGRGILGEPLNAQHLHMQLRIGRRDFRGVDLSGFELPRIDLSWTDLTAVNLSGADLGQANLRRADLPEADLSQAFLRAADLMWADLSEANGRRATYPGPRRRSAQSCS